VTKDISGRPWEYLEYMHVVLWKLIFHPLCFKRFTRLGDFVGGFAFQIWKTSWVNNMLSLGIAKKCLIPVAMLG